MDSTLLFQLFPDWLNFFFIEIMAFTIVDTKWLVIMPGWALVHFLVGFLLMFLIIKYDTDDKPFLTVFLLLVAFEMFEFLISYPLGVILQEELADTIFDLAIGMAGAAVYWFFFKDKF